MEIGTKLVADTTEARARGLYCDSLVDGQVYTVNYFQEHLGLTFFTVEGVYNQDWTVEPDCDGDSYKQFFKLEA